VPALKAVKQVQVKQKRQEVEHVVTQSGTQTAANTDGGTGVHRSSLGSGDWIKLNGPFNLHQIESVTVRYADAAAGRTAGTPLAAIELRTGSQTGTLVATMPLTSTGATGTWNSLDFPVSLTGRNDLFLVFRSVTGGATGGNLFNLNWLNFNGNGVTVQKTEAPGSAGGEVPATLSLSLGNPARFEPFVPGVAKTYEASTTANVISSAGDATLSVSSPGTMTNGAFSLPQPLQVAMSKTSWTGPVANDPVAITFKQAIGATDALRTGTYSKTVTFTLSTTNP
jgi:hypothetical protein